MSENNGYAYKAGYSDGYSDAMRVVQVEFRELRTGSAHLGAKKEKAIQDTLDRVEPVIWAKAIARSGTHTPTWIVEQPTLERE